MKKISFLLAAVFMLSGCKSHKSNGESSDFLTIDCTKYDGNAVLPFDSIFEFDEYILLETNDSSMISRCYKIHFNGDRIYINDGSKRILVFNADGTFCREYKHLGEGPGEYARLYDFDIYDGKLHLLDGMKGMIYVYSLDDELLETIEVPKCNGFKILPDGVALNVGLGYADGSSDKPYSYKFKPARGGDMVEAVPFNRHLCGHSYTFSTGGNNFFEYGNKIFTYFPLNDTIYTVNPQNGELAPYAKINLGDRSVALDADKATADAILEGNMPKNIHAFYNWGDTLMFSYTSENALPIMVIADKTGVLHQGAMRLDKNGMPVSEYAYDTSDKNQRFFLSILQAPNAKVLAEYDKAPGEHSVLHEIASQITEEDNPVLVKYNLRNQ
ncbi:6-bladed beta-propeller [uncultured Muribaculum sp.]|uniref:6-bladed beta-propeller n=1 Tax=uncultured Muribaculum sp. TaxID=1918613 RepID=UPI002597CF80|nr:6-bladed beta-propeller [uncultured Muribaculum sp.]